MSALDFPDLATEPLPDGLVEAGVFQTKSEAEEYGLVVLALGQPYWLVASPAGQRLLIEREAAELVRRHLTAYAHERIGWPPAPIVDSSATGPVHILTPLLWGVVVLAVFRVQGRWVDAGMLDAHALFVRGEIWRLATALFLHANAAHVISNALSGILVFSAVLSTIGRLRGWVLLAVGAILGNLATAAINHPTIYRSLGASTAIFAGIGLLTGRAVRVGLRSKHPHRWRTMFVPFAAGLTVLALYGAGDVRVDVGAHACGFASGLALGFACGLRPASS